MGTQQAIRSPWPGPQPYDEEHRDVFFGRGEEVAHTIERVFRERLVILTGPSAAGKTSVLRAGVVPALRYLRKLYLQGDPTAPMVGPALVLRDWTAGATSIDDALCDAIRDAVNRIPDDMESDRETLTAMVARPSSFFSAVVKICAETGGVILVLDQLEEVLRPDSKTANKARVNSVIDLISQLHEFEPKAKLLLSLREEFHSDLRGLESVVKGLYGRTSWLAPMRESAAREAVRESAKVSGIGIEDDAIDEILLWVRRAEEAEGADQDESDPLVNLLGLQAVLDQLHATLVGQSPSDRPVMIDHDEMKTFAKGRLGEEIVEQAMRRWVRLAIEGLGDESHSLQGPQELKDFDDAQLTGLIRHVAIRMAPFLSASGYKIPMKGRELVSKALRGEVLRLGTDPAALFGEVAPIPSEAQRGAGDESDAVVSGVARKGRWTKEQTVAALRQASLETLQRLRRKNVLRNIPSPDGNDTWQLVHDGLGEPFAEWATDERGSFHDALYSVVVQRGNDISASTPGKPRLVESLNWRGCWVGPTGEPPVFEDMEFRDCNLRGTLFQGCTFRGVRFVNCEVHGTIFEDCSFEGTQANPEVVFENCRGDGLTFSQCIIRSLAFASGVFRHLVMTAGALPGAVRFAEDVSVTSGTFTDLGGDSEGQIRFDDCRLRFCWWDTDTDALIKFSSATKRKTYLAQMDPDFIPFRTASRQP